jgi:hypothetical protein
MIGATTTGATTTIGSTNVTKCAAGITSAKQIFRRV